MQDLTVAVLGELEDCACLLVDGTCWQDDELIRLGLAGKTARQMGHLPVSGPGGSLGQLAALPIERKIYIHINNTNPDPARRLAGAARRRAARHAGRRGWDGTSDLRGIVTVLETDSFVSALRAHSLQYHDSHSFHRRMNEGSLSRRQIQGWVANRFYYQENIPRKDAAIIANCPDREVRRRWIRRILDHDGTAGSGWRHRGLAAAERGGRADPRGGAATSAMSSPGCGSPSTPT